jgi:formate dehydrogenase major subunit
MLYSRASADPDGTPWSERKRYVWWDGEKWTGYDVPDFPVDKRPDYKAPPDAKGMDAISGDDPFIMLADGRAWLYAPSGLLDGPMPTHYEPLESPLENPLYPSVHANPAALKWTRRDNPYAEPGDPRYPCVATTFRLTEHHTAGGMSRWLPWLDELQPEMFAEIDPALAKARGIEDGGWMTITSPRAEIVARARVTDRIRPLKIDRATVHQVALPWHWGQDVAANNLIMLTGDPNTSIHEAKAFVCNVRAGRNARGTTLLAGVRDTPPGVAPNRDHPAEVTEHE